MVAYLLVEDKLWPKADLPEIRILSHFTDSMKIHTGKLSIITVAYCYWDVSKRSNAILQDVTWIQYPS